jgi:hypothetical protein
VICGWCLVLYVVLFGCLVVRVTEALQTLAWHHQQPRQQYWQQQQQQQQQQCWLQQAGHDQEWQQLQQQGFLAQFTEEGAAASGGMSVYRLHQVACELASPEADCSSDCSAELLGRKNSRAATIKLGSE